MRPHENTELDDCFETCLYTCRNCIFSNCTQLNTQHVIGEKFHSHTFTKRKCESQFQIKISMYFARRKKNNFDKTIYVLAKFENGHHRN
jgi:hypothetical protein